MNFLWMLKLVLHCPTLTWALSCEDQSKLQDVIATIGAVTGEIPFLSTAVRLLDVYVE